MERTFHTLRQGTSNQEGQGEQWQRVSKAGPRCDTPPLNSLNSHKQAGGPKNTNTQEQNDLKKGQSV